MEPQDTMVVKETAKFMKLLSESGVRAADVSLKAYEFALALQRDFEQSMQMEAAAAVVGEAAKLAGVHPNQLRPGQERDSSDFGPIELHTHVRLDGQEIAGKVSKIQAQDLRRQGVRMLNQDRPDFWHKAYDSIMNEKEGTTDGSNKDE